MESFLSYTYKIDDERLLEENIAKEVLGKITLLNGLYNAMVQRRGEFMKHVVRSTPHKDCTETTQEYCRILR